MVEGKILNGLRLGLVEFGWSEVFINFIAYLDCCPSSIRSLLLVLTNGLSFMSLVWSTLVQFTDARIREAEINLLIYIICFTEVPGANRAELPS